MGSPFCIPRMKNSRWTKKTNRVTPMSLLDRFREAVFRLIVLSAFTKAARPAAASHGRKSPESAQKQAYYKAYEPHHSEAVADCIEFIKKSAFTDGNRSSTASFSIDDDDIDVVRHLPAGYMIYQNSSF
ncbi:OLC1v1011034C1 [Oldenlandia corymbosa var. corymbosa]|uniref:OLC1v1011034C1 n=1 Tax=Oldenlandia corymbosa var. corymbosa TaxID=529605 RepID=A0AAV1DVR3_OLDCO|nr:OLC1v1011034C1 [Oldenlandia corymbosa var. corymbosa]